MRTIFSASIAALALLLAACGGDGGARLSASTAQAGDGLVVMTFNIRYGTAKDGPDAWDARKDHLLETIRAQDPAILGVQEALDFQVRFLEAALPHHKRVGQGRDGGARGEHSALFVDERRCTIVEHGDFWLSETPERVASVGWDAALTRMCTWARVKEAGGGCEFMVWNTHFDHVGETARVRSAELVAARTKEHALPQLVLGDLNTGEASAALAALRVAGFVDTWRELHPDAGDAGTFHAFRGGREGEKIDYVLRSAGWRTIEAAILDKPGPSGRWPSDHHAVVARVAPRP